MLGQGRVRKSAPSPQSVSPDHPGPVQGLKACLLSRHPVWARHAVRGRLQPVCHLGLGDRMISCLP